jgi:hypothetical protein
VPIHHYSPTTSSPSSFFLTTPTTTRPGSRCQLLSTTTTNLPLLYYYCIPNYRNLSLHYQLGIGSRIRDKTRVHLSFSKKEGNVNVAQLSPHSAFGTSGTLLIITTQIQIQLPFSQFPSLRLTGTGENGLSLQLSLLSGKYIHSKQYIVSTKIVLIRLGYRKGDPVELLVTMSVYNVRKLG